MLVGGSLALNEDVMRKLNGFTNIMFGWGGEDDNFCVRFVCLYVQNSTKSVEEQLVKKIASLQVESQQIHR